MLSTQWIERFKRYFREPFAVWHSSVPAAQRARIWADVAQGKVRVVVGARSAVGLAFQNLGLIVVDEEHDSTYKQEDGVVYHARDMAILRAKCHQVPVVLVSATPSCETHYNLQRGRYRRVELTQRYHDVSLPKIEVIDLRQHQPPAGQWLSRPFLESVGQTLSSGGQSLVFVNRRGYAPLTLCKACGHRKECPNCVVSLVQHRSRQQMVCHYCGHTEALPTRCPSCHTDASFIAYGPGAERMTEELQQAFPQARVRLLTSDTLSDVRQAQAAIHEIQSGVVDIVVGTQILAKGHDFVNLRCVGVVNADQGLAGVDLRASERAFQVLEQVTGRSGRHGPGVACVQTYMPEHPLLQALVSGDRNTFWEQELHSREHMAMPPFTRLVGLVVSSPEAVHAETSARALVRLAPPHPEIAILGPVPAPLSKLRGRFRWRILLRAQRHVSLQTWVRRWLAIAKVQSVELRRARLEIDVDPQTFL
jgi:primosomal protein N' (replication factor Y)